MCLALLLRTLLGPKWAATHGELKCFAIRRLMAKCVMDSVVVEGWSDCGAVLWCRVGSTGNAALIFVRKTVWKGATWRTENWVCCEVWTWVELAQGFVRWPCLFVFLFLPVELSYFTRNEVSTGCFIFVFPCITSL